MSPLVVDAHVRVVQVAAVLIAVVAADGEAAEDRRLRHPRVDLELDAVVVLLRSGIVLSTLRTWPRVAGSWL